MDLPMNGRLAVLIVATAVFAAAWGGDRNGRRADTRVAYRRHMAPRTTLVAEQTSRLAELQRREARGAETMPVDVKRVSGRDSAMTVRTGAVDVSGFQEETIRSPLPVDIAAGEYRVVSSHGEVYSLTLTEVDLAEAGIPDVIPPRSSYVVEADGVEWFYVRVEEERLDREPRLAAGVVP